MVDGPGEAVEGSGKIVGGSGWVVDAGLWDAEATDDGLGDSVGVGLGEVSGGSSGLVDVGVCGDDVGTCTSVSTDICFIVAIWVITAKGVKKGNSVCMCM